MFAINSKNYTMKIIISSILFFSIILCQAQSKIIFGNYSFEISKDYKKHIFSNLEITENKKNGIIIPTDFFIYNGDLNGAFISIGYWISNDEFSGNNSEFEELVKEISVRKYITNNLKSTLPKNATCEFKKLNSVYFIETSFQRPNQEYVFTFYIFELGKRYNILIKYNDIKFLKYKNEIINSLQRIN